MRAAISLGCHPFASFWRCTSRRPMPVSAPVACWCFILAIGYYITPALLGSPNDQMVSYFVAFYTNDQHQLGHGDRTRWAVAAGDRGALSDLQLAGGRQSPAPELRGE